MSINEIIVYLMVLFMALGAIDRIIGNRFGLGEKFEEGILAMGSLALAMIGIICLAPVLASLLRPVVVPVYQFLGADPAMFAGTILANDMGGAPLARELALTQEAGQFGGLIVGSMLGPTIVFTIPVGLGIIKAEDRPHLATGVLAYDYMKKHVEAFNARYPNRRVHLYRIENRFFGEMIVMFGIVDRKDRSKTPWCVSPSLPTRPARSTAITTGRFWRQTS